MRKLFYLILSVGLLINWTSFAATIWGDGCSWLVGGCTSWGIDIMEDNQLINIDNSWDTKELSVNFNLQKFSSCENLEDVIKKYIKDYNDLYPNNYYRWWMDDILHFKANDAEVSGIAESVNDTSSVAIDEIKATDYSETNIQVKWVDESEIIKTDWKNIYYYNEAKHSIFIVKAFPATSPEVLKVIKIPESFSNPEIYVNWSKLIIIANKYIQGNYSYYWFNREQKTVVVTYDISNLKNLKLEKYYQADGYTSKSRRIGKYLYVLSTSSFDFPYQNYYGPVMEDEVLNFDSNKLEKDFDAKRVLPKKAELKITSIKSEQNVKIRWKNLPYNLTQGYSSKCADIEFVMPDKETLKKFDFSPSYVTLSIINTEDPSEEVSTKVLFWDVNEVYMSLDNLYITSNLYTNYNFKCPEIQCIKSPCPSFPCSMPYFSSWENTLIHKIGLNWKNTKYSASTIVSWSPLNQYSMDQNWVWSFRIVTSSFSPEQSTNVFVLDKNLKTVWKLTGLWKNENFKSSRFIWDKLYLVTFQQIDPLFVIDLSSDNNPKVLWELKIPWYSTYLHPYDETHLIWLGSDTVDNWYGWLKTGWLKIDLYDVADLKNPKQQYSLTLWDQGSSSEALNNPRVFVWNDKTKTLFLPATLFTNAWDKTDSYRNSDVYQGSIAVKIDSTSWIKELSKVTHIDTAWIEEKRNKACLKYSVKETPKCQTIIGWWEYCPPANNYIPTYCYESSPIWEYLANQIWNYNNSFIVRNLFLDNLWVTVSNDKIQANDLNNNYKKLYEVIMK